MKNTQIRILADSMVPMDDVPPPAPRPGRYAGGRSGWADLVGRMRSGQYVDIPTRYMHGFVQEAKEQGFCVIKKSVGVRKWDKEVLGLGEFSSNNLRTTRIWVVDKSKKKHASS